MKKYCIYYEEEEMKNEKEGKGIYFEYDQKMFDNLKEAKQEFEKFESKMHWDDNHVRLYKDIATLQEVIVDEDDDIIEVVDDIDCK